MSNEVETELLPRWTVGYNVVSSENDRWVGTGWEFFDSETDAIVCYRRHREIGNCPFKRPFHKTDAQHLGTFHKLTRTSADYIRTQAQRAAQELDRNALLYASRDDRPLTDMELTSVTAIIESEFTSLPSEPEK